MIQNLNGEWQFKQADDATVYSGKVPGCNFIDLLDNKLIDDPFIGVNEKHCVWVGEKDWIYFRSFELNQAMLDCDELWLKCDRLDTICDVYLNGIVIGKANNAHRNYSFDIRDYVQLGTNHLQIYFYSPVEYVRKKQAIVKCPNNNNGQNGIPHIRKPQSHFGWDWGPVLPPSGISGDIYIQGYNIANIKHVRINQTHNQDNVVLNITATINRINVKSVKVMIGVLCPDGKEIVKEVDCKSNFSSDILIEKPQLWWTYELSQKKEQPLYKVQVAIFNEGIQLDKQEKLIGLRTIQLSRARDKYGYDFCFVLNGVRIFSKGANWIPSDSFLNRTSKEKLHSKLQDCIDCNFNIIRVWGGGYYESDDFYDFCDRKGLLVWQDFCFACQPYPFFDEDFLQNVLQEVKENVLRLRHHASLAVWNGNNEIEAMSIQWLMRKEFVKWTEKFFYHILPDYLVEFDNVTPYLEGSPCGVSHNNGFDKDNVGDTHLWAVWHGLQPMQYYRKRFTRFCSEFGFESLPDIKTIKKFAQPRDYSLGCEVFTAHQKCNSGNNKMIYYIADRFRLPKIFEDYIYLSQVCQLECIEDATMHWRRNKGRCNGAIYWQLNDCWPVCSWSSVDYYGNYKALQYGAKRFFSPLAVSVCNKKSSVQVWGLNDLLEDHAVNIQAKLINFDGKVMVDLSQEVVLKAQESECLLTYDISEMNEKELKKCVFYAQLYKQGQLIGQVTCLFGKEKKLQLPAVNIKRTCTIENNVATVILSSNKYARIVNISSKYSQGAMSDNFFDILPNQYVTITFAVNSGITAEQIEHNLSIMSAVDIKPKGSKFSDFLTRLRIFFIPKNFFSWLYERRKIKDMQIK